MRVKQDSEKVGIKLNIQNTKIMVSGPITSWQIDGEKVERVTNFILTGSKMNVDSDCSHEIKTLALGKKVLTNLDRALKTRSYFANKSTYSQSYGFSSNHVRT